MPAPSGVSSPRSQPRTSSWSPSSTLPSDTFWPNESMARSSLYQFRANRVWYTSVVKARFSVGLNSWPTTVWLWAVVMRSWAEAA